jgi:hypothetical protein
LPFLVIYVQFASTVANKLPELDLPVKREIAFFLCFFFAAGLLSNPVKVGERKG